MVGVRCPSDEHDETVSVERQSSSLPTHVWPLLPNCSPSAAASNAPLDRLQSALAPPKRRARARVAAPPAPSPVPRAQTRASERPATLDPNLPETETAIARRHETCPPRSLPNVASPPCSANVRPQPPSPSRSPVHRRQATCVDRPSLLHPAYLETCIAASSALVLHPDSNCAPPRPAPHRMTITFSGSRS